MAKPPFDPQKAAFILVAAVIGVHAVLVLAFGVACLWHSDRIVGTDNSCDPNSRMMALLAAALAAALAFAGIKKDK